MVNESVKLDPYKMQMDALLSLSKQQERAQEQKASSNTQGQMMGHIGNFMDIATKPVATQSEIMAGQIPQGTSGLGQGWKQAGAGIQQQGAQGYEDLLSRYKTQNRMTTTLAKLKEIESGKAKDELETKVLQEQYDESQKPYKETKEYEKQRADYGLKEGYESAKEELKAVKADAGSLQDLYKTVKGEGRGLLVIRHKYEALSKVERALVQLEDVANGRRVPDMQMMTDLSAAQTSMVTGGIPPLQLIGDTMYKSLQGEMQKMRQWATGKPVAFNTAPVVQQIKQAFGTFNKQIKHELSKHATTAFNRHSDLLKRNPQYTERVLHDFGHMIGSMKEDSYLTKPRSYDDPYTSINKSFYPKTIAEINERKRPAPEGKQMLANEQPTSFLDSIISPASANSSLERPDDLDNLDDSELNKIFNLEVLGGK